MKKILKALWNMLSYSLMIIFTIVSLSALYKTDIVIDIKIWLSITSIGIVILLFLHDMVRHWDNKLEEIS